MPRQTTIVCTIGPACRDYATILKLIGAGMDVARLHCSYADQPEHAENIHSLRQAARELGREIKIMLDLSGAKVRLKHFAREAVQLNAGAEFTLTSREMEGNEFIAAITIPELISVVQPGDTVLLDDGALKLEALSTTASGIHCRVLVGGHLKSRQAVHVPGKAAPIRVPTPKDFDDVRFGIQHQVDWIAQSYATTAREINDLRDFLRRHNADISIVAKIERRDALKNLAAITRSADLVMVARGDLGLEIPLEQIALAQKQIIRCANEAGKPVITATEMLASMMEHDRPTRAEVADITNAILDGANAVMLSGETSMGKYPVEAVKMTSQIIQATEHYLASISSLGNFTPRANTSANLLTDISNC